MRTPTNNSALIILLIDQQEQPVELSQVSSQKLVFWKGQTWVSG